MSLEDLMQLEVSSASRHPQDVRDAPSSVTVVTAEEIRQHGYRTLADVLQGVRSFYVNYDRNYSYIGMRGFAPPGDYNSRILLLVDGHRLNDNVYDQAPIGTELPLDIEGIDHIEIVRGPSSSIYGGDAFLAVINLITKSRSSVKIGELSADFDSLRGYKGHFVIGQSLPRNVDMLLAGGVYSSAGPSPLFFPNFNSAATNYGNAIKCDDDLAKDILAKFMFRGLTLESLLGSREKGIPTGSFKTVFDDPRNRTIDSYGNLVLSFHHRFAESTDVMSALSYNRYEYSGNYIYTGNNGPSSTVVNRDWSRGQWWGWEGQLHRHFGPRNEITVGTEIRDNTRQDQRTYYIGQLPSLDKHESSNIQAAYLQDEVGIASWLKVNAGVRYDRYDTFGGTVNPRLASLFRVNDRTTIKLLYGQAFRPPNAFELFYSLPGSQEANPVLRPETIRTYEVTIDRDISSHVQLSASGYYYRISNLIQETVDSQNGLLIFDNAAFTHSKGVEFEMRGQWAGGIEAKASYSLQSSRNGTTGLTLSDSPSQLAKVSATLPIFSSRLFINPEGEYMSRRHSLTSVDAGGFGIVNLSIVARKLAQAVEASLTAYNLLNKRYSDPGGPEQVQPLLTQDGRSLRAKIAFFF